MQMKRPVEQPVTDQRALMVRPQKISYKQLYHLSMSHHQVLVMRIGRNAMMKINLKVEHDDFRLVYALSWSNSPTSNFCYIIL
jgi:hypothetical protein